MEKVYFKSSEIKDPKWQDEPKLPDIPSYCKRTAVPQGTANTVSEHQ